MTAAKLKVSLTLSADVVVLGQERRRRSSPRVGVESPLFAIGLDGIEVGEVGERDGGAAVFGEQGRMELAANVHSAAEPPFGRNGDERLPVVVLDGARVAQLGRPLVTYRGARESLGPRQCAWSAGSATYPPSVCRSRRERISKRNRKRKWIRRRGEGWTPPPRSPPLERFPGAPRQSRTERRTWPTTSSPRSSATSSTWTNRTTASRPSSGRS